MFTRTAQVILATRAPEADAPTGDRGQRQGCSTLSVVVHIAQGFDAPEGGGVAILGDGVGLIELQDIISEAAQSGEDAWVAADARGIFTEGDVAGVVLFVFDTPMFANG